MREVTGHAALRLHWRPPKTSEFVPIPTERLFSSHAALEQARSESGEVVLWSDTGIGSPRTFIEISHAWPLASLGLAPGDRIEYWIDAIDLNDVTQPGRSSSERFEIVIDTEERVRQALFEELGDYLGEIDLIEKRQREIAEDVGGTGGG
jgi:hypothetical protein